MNQSQKTILEKKAEENYHCALYAEQNKLFNVAISRFYYCALLSSKDYLVNHMGIPEDMLRGSEGSSSHNKIISFTINKLNEERKTEYRRNAHKIKKFNKIQKARNLFEYDPVKFCDEVMYVATYRQMIKDLLIALKEIDVLLIEGEII